MKLNVDFTKRVVIDTEAIPWIPSPEVGVDRKMLERDGGELAKATSIVRYAPGAKFPQHTHDRGEEYLVLDGVFEDALGTYAPGTYVRNPPGSSHAPHSELGCLLLVKLRHFEPDDTDRLVINLHDGPWRKGLVPGLTVQPLHSHGTSSTAFVRWEPGTKFNAHRHYGGEEIFVVDGTFEDEHGAYPRGTWIRSPHLSLHTPFSTEGCTILVKTGHLPVTPRT